ncbi:type II toxin-antitoxin system death-on-curing family toxin [Roseibium aggregatum]|uniref:Type II toxin-antitoxin system death-on-curing family toxin n=1 Tax=Roseibium aggregatum TaxID=187304 RepID=A0A939J2W5_9HYPH|nr:type II toxin-antitoxin system death-on-curing family toxin [Roseibium aggregatum]MBN9671848.1 type II toxin-antitoxin system death-on-curing family toxin [Roseibium aggregatum]
MQVDLLNWLEPKDLVLINRIHVEATRETFGVSDRARLEAAVMRPQLAYYNDNQKDVLSLAVQFVSSICEARAFLESNKRTAFTAARAFLMSNGYDIDPKVDRIMDSNGQPMIISFLETIAKDPFVAAEFERWLAPFVFPLKNRGLESSGEGGELTLATSNGVKKTA